MQILIYDHENIKIDRVKAKVDKFLKSKKCSCNSEEVIKVIARQSKDKLVGEVFKDYLNAPDTDYIDFVLVGNKGANLSSNNT